MAEAVESASGDSLPAAVMRFVKSSIGGKAIMAVTGLIMWGWLIAHLAGNLLLFLGPDATNDYSKMLHAVPEILWLLRAVVIVAIVAHFYIAIRTTFENRAARPVPYAYANKTEATLASRTMIWSGLVVVTFIVYHLLHLTLHKIYPDHVQLRADGSVDVYRMLVMGFQIPAVSMIYIVGQLFLAGHLSHGVYSQFQHLGLWGPKWSPFLKKASVVVGYGMSALFISIPFSVIAGLVKLP